jgi:homoserine dehydrogenase
MNRNNLTIGLFGFGCVGNGLHEVLQKTPTLKTNIKTICVKDRNKQRLLPDSCFTFDKNDILNDPEINVVVELIDDADAAYEIVSNALKGGKAVVTANKKMIAEHFEELLELQRIHNVPLLYEAACCASIPIIRNLEEYYDNDLLESIEGIVNGSTNYILTKTVEEKLSFDQALKYAQINGYAESDPTLDICGFDAKFKLLILLAHAFGTVVKPEHIFNLGIDKLNALELNYAREKDLKIKLLAQAYKNVDGSIAAFVLPKFIDKSDKLYNVDDVFNGILTKTSFADTQFFSGKGAGAHPTASAVISDISALTYNYSYEYKKLNFNEKLAQPSDIVLQVFLSCKTDLCAELRPYFSQIDETYSNQSEAFFIGAISLENLKFIFENNPNQLSAVLIKTLLTSNQ